MKLCHFIGCTWRCGSPEKAAEASEDIRQSERSIFRRFGKAWKDNYLPTRNFFHKTDKQEIFRIFGKAKEV